MEMNRDFFNLNYYLNKLLLDVYPQPPDAGTTALIKDVMDKWIVNMTTCKSVLDIGCGATAVAEQFFTPLGMEYTGIALGEDAVNAQSLGYNVKIMDMSFLEFEDGSFDLIFARHVLEHSPMPLLTLMEWSRVARHWLCVIVPKASHFGRTGMNHYSVLEEDHWLWLMDRAGWRPMWEDHFHEQEMRFMMERKR
jgi:SAM-dependent methyltransferase